MEKQFGKPLTLKGLENGDLGDSKYSISREVQRENGKLAKDSGQLLKVADKGRETQKTNGHWNKCMSLGGIKSTAKETQCKYCDLKGTGPSIDRHTIRCLNNPAFFNELSIIVSIMPNEFTRKDLINTSSVRTFFKIEDSGLIKKTGQFKNRFPIYTKV